MSAMAMFAVQRGLQTQTAMVDAFTQQAMAELQSENISRQMGEIESRTRMQTQNIYKQAERIQSAQEAAFVSGGVDMTGSPMSVINDTLNEAAQAAYIRQRESDYELVGMSMQRAAFDRMASNQTLFMNLAAAVAGGGAGLSSDYFKYNSANMRNRGASGIGDEVSYNYQPGANEGMV